MYYFDRFCRRCINGSLNSEGNSLKLPFSVYLSVFFLPFRDGLFFWLLKKTRHRLSDIKIQTKKMKAKILSHYEVCVWVGYWNCDYLFSIHHWDWILWTESDFAKYFVKNCVKKHTQENNNNTLGWYINNKIQIYLCLIMYYFP